ncbi:MAG TPA: hypothetical protein VGD78_20910 [Chthoniobacterales bacterium]
MTGNEVTFETEQAAKELQAALQALGIASVAVPSGKQHKVKVSL